MQESLAQIFEQALSAHQKGELERARRLYKVVLASEPLQPDANCNLGLLAASSNRYGTACSYFKTALTTRPDYPQAWFGYVDALVKNKQINSAKRAIQTAKSKGLDAKSLSVLLPRSKAQKAASSPTEALLSKLIDSYQKQNLIEAEQQAISITKRYPAHPLAWKVLCALLQQTGRASHALTLCQKAVECAPSDPQSHYILALINLELGWKNHAQDAYKQAIKLKPDFAEAHNGLGNTFRQLGKLEEAETCHVEAIVIAPNFAEAYNDLGNTLRDFGRLQEAKANYIKAIEVRHSFATAHSNLGNTLIELGSFEEAQTCLARAIKLKPDFIEAHSALGLALQKMGKLEEAETRLTGAIKLSPEYAEAHNNLGIVLLNLGRLEEAEACFEQSIALAPNFEEAIFNLANSRSYLNNPEAEIRSWEDSVNSCSGVLKLRAQVSLSICKYLTGEISEAQRLLSASNGIHINSLTGVQNERAYHTYLTSLIQQSTKQDFKARTTKAQDTVYVIGESHSLVSHRFNFERLGGSVLCEAKLIKGCMQWHLGSGARNQYKYAFEKIFESLPASSEVLIAIGEIDCRLDSGIIKHHKKAPQKSTLDIVSETIDGYLRYLKDVNSVLQHNITIQGVPCPNIAKEEHSKDDVEALIELIRVFNRKLKERCTQEGLGFLDVHELTDNGTGFSNGIWHIDRIHLNPDGISQAWSKYYLSAA